MGNFLFGLLREESIIIIAVFIIRIVDHLLSLNRRQLITVVLNLRDAIPFLLPISILIICTIRVVCKSSHIYQEIIISIFVVDMGFFPFDRLPLNLQEKILTLLPISTLIVCTNVSHSFRSLIRSQSFISSYKTNNSDNFQPLFVFSDDTHTPSTSVYDSLSDRWLSLSFPPDARFNLASAGPLLLSSSTFDTQGYFLLFNPFSICQIPIQIPRLNLIDYSYITLVSRPPYDNFKIVMVHTWQQFYSLTYDSRTREWVKNWGLQGWSYHGILNGVLLDDGLLYCMTLSPAHLLVFDPLAEGGQWDVVDVALPPVKCLTVLAFGRRLFLVGAVREDRYVVRIGIWEIDWVRMEWKVHCYMPGDVFVELSRGSSLLSNFQTVVGINGKICFYCSMAVLMYDLEARRWWWPERRNTKVCYQYVHAVEPSIDMVKGNM